MKMYVGITDYNWFQYLKSINLDEVNFWQPKSSRNFKAIRQGELFLFKLHSPRNFIVGGGVFVKHVLLPLSLIWDAFGVKNGTTSRENFLEAIYKYRNTNRLKDPDPIIGSLILANPFFLDESHWITVPKSWSPNIVQGKTYDTETLEGRRLYNEVQSKLASNLYVMEQENRYGDPQLIKPRLGQGGFRTIVTEAYNRRCAMTGEKTLPVLQASHIKPYSKQGPHAANNGLLLRQDIHTLFDRRYMTINENSVIEVSRLIKEAYGNGRDYYALHGKSLSNIPNKVDERPSQEFLLCHNENVYMG